MNKLPNRNPETYEAEVLEESFTPDEDISEGVTLDQNEKPEENLNMENTGSLKSAYDVANERADKIMSNDEVLADEPKSLKSSYDIAKERAEKISDEDPEVFSGSNEELTLNKKDNPDIESVSAETKTEETEENKESFLNLKTFARWSSLDSISTSESVINKEGKKTEKVESKISKINSKKEAAIQKFQNKKKDYEVAMSEAGESFNDVFSKNLEKLEQEHQEKLKSFDSKIGELEKKKSGYAEKSNERQEKIDQIRQKYLDRVDVSVGQYKERVGYESIQSRITQVDAQIEEVKAAQDSLNEKLSKAQIALSNKSLLERPEIKEIRRLAKELSSNKKELDKKISSSEKTRDRLNRKIERFDNRVSKILELKTLFEKKEPKNEEVVADSESTKDSQSNESTQDSIEVDDISSSTESTEKVSEDVELWTSDKFESVLSKKNIDEVIKRIESEKDVDDIFKKTKKDNSSFYDQFPKKDADRMIVHFAYNNNKDIRKKLIAIIELSQ